MYLDFFVLGLGVIIMVAVVSHESLLASLSSSSWLTWSLALSLCFASPSPSTCAQELESAEVRAEHRWLAALSDRFATTTATLDQRRSSADRLVEMNNCVEYHRLS